MTDHLQELADGEKKPSWLAGRAGRKEYWLWIGPLMILGVALGLAGMGAAGVIAGVPMLLVTIRRLHDLGRTGWFAPLINIGLSVLGFIFGMAVGEDLGTVLAVLAQAVVVIVLGAWPGQPHSNDFGPPPGATATSKVADTFS